MIVVQIKGGLGNQMFQYALARAIDVRTEFEIKLDITWFEGAKKTREYGLGRFRIKEFNHITRSERQMLKLIRRLKKGIFHKLIPNNWNIYEEKRDWEYDQNVFDTKDNTYIKGYWQNYRYFQTIKEKIRRDFTFPEFRIKKNLNTSKEMNSENSVSLHLRKGDYRKYKHLFEVCGSSYYESAISYILKKMDNPKFYVFSDDIDQVKANSDLEQILDKTDITYIDWNKDNVFRDMQLMKTCKHNIIANSTFSWWAAWLNRNRGKVVISPEQWTYDERNASGLMLKDWVKLPTKPK